MGVRTMAKILIVEDEIPINNLIKKICVWLDMNVLRFLTEKRSLMPLYQSIMI